MIEHLSKTEKTKLYKYKRDIKASIIAKVRKIIEQEKIKEQWNIIERADEISNYKIFLQDPEFQEIKMKYIKVMKSEEEKTLTNIIERIEDI